MPVLAGPTKTQGNERVDYKGIAIGYQPLLRVDMLGPSKFHHNTNFLERSSFEMA